MSEICFISGSCGVGKSTLIPYLKKMLPENKYRVFDFDQRGVPENADSSWRKSEAEYWMSVASELGKKDISTIVCGFVKPSDLAGDVKFILLDIQPEILRQRLIGRYSQNGVFDSSQKVIGKPVLDFIESNIYILGEMRKMFQLKNSTVIDTSNLTPEEVAIYVINYLHKIYGK